MSTKTKFIVLIGVIIIGLLLALPTQSISDPLHKTYDNITNLYDGCNVHYEDVLYMITIFSGDDQAQVVIDVKYPQFKNWGLAVHLEDVRVWRID